MTPANSKALAATLLTTLLLMAGIAVQPACAQDGGLVPMTDTGLGTLELTVSVDGVAGQFLLDTGAGMLMISKELFTATGGEQAHEHVRQIALRLANNRIEVTDVYRIDSLRVGGCELGPLEAAIGKAKSRNLLGLGALRGAAPLFIEMVPPSIQLHGCQKPPEIAAVAG
ncbi:MAG: retropepsin-like aspartic protease [Halieaceae bacterium]|jgi:predicted aspartyl protease|nr:retropepsin-like aspartic protease [Halieaceae bacterium]